MNLRSEPTFQILERPRIITHLFPGTNHSVIQSILKSRIINTQPMTQAREVIRIGQTTVTFLLEGKDTNAQLAMFEFTVPVGAKVPIPHSHERYDETVYGIEGVITFTVNGTPHDVGPGETFFIPRGTVHGFNNIGKTDTKTLAVVTPALLGPEFFKEVAALIHVGGPPDIEKIKAAYSKYGLKPAPPPKG